MTAELKLSVQSGKARASQARGDDAEDLVETINQLPQVAELAFLSRRFARQARVRGRLRYVAAQGPDFSGWVHVRGSRPVPIEIEVKARPEGRLDFCSFSDRQTEVLSALKRDGGLALVLVVYGPVLHRAQFCPVPWVEVLRIQAEGRASMKAEEILRYAASEQERYLLEAWQRWEGEGR